MKNNKFHCNEHNLQKTYSYISVLKFVNYHYLHIFFFLFIFLISSNNIQGNKIESKFLISSENTTNFKFQLMLKYMMKFKVKNNKILTDLIQATNVKRKFYRTSSSSTMKISEVPQEELNEKIHPQFKYKSYRKLLEALYELEKNCNLVKISVAQERYQLPYPGGKCDNGKLTEKYYFLLRFGDKCPHIIVELTDFTSKEEKHQIYISGAVHGNERVGPNASLELIELMCSERKNKWINKLLKTRLIIITPMTNPHGYNDNIREEILLKDEDSYNLTSNRYVKTHKDINRDFPYLITNNNCFESIGARVVNEIFLEHIFSLSLSLHGGTESFTYPYGTPNHIIGNPSIEMEYTFLKDGVITHNYKSSDETILNKYLDGEYDEKIANLQSTPAPDLASILSITNSSNYFTSNNPTKKYKTGDMSSTVYPVRGGMEDWAYGGSWEGSPIITKPCKPNTYGGYSENKVKYEDYPYALRSVMYLLEISYDKNPEQKELGRKNYDCILKLRDNAFFDKKLNQKEINYCGEDNIDGYIPKILRLSLALIDILSPYLETKYTIEEKKIIIYFNVGGSIEINEAKFRYLFTNNKDEELSSSKNLKTKELKNLKGIWDLNFTSDIQPKIELEKEDFNFLIYDIEAKPDRSWGDKKSENPNIGPVSNLVNLRLSDDYIAKNSKFTLKGKSSVKSEVVVINLKP